MLIHTYILSSAFSSLSSFEFSHFCFIVLNLNKSWQGGVLVVVVGVQQDELPLESRLKYTHHQLSRRLSEKEVFAFSLAAANHISPPHCLRPIPPSPRYASSQWEDGNVRSVGQSASSCYVGGRIDKRGIFFFPLFFFFTSSHYRLKARDTVACQAACRLRTEPLNIQTPHLL